MTCVWNRRHASDINMAMCLAITLAITLATADRSSASPVFIMPLVPPSLTMKAATPVPPAAPRRVSAIAFASSEPAGAREQGWLQEDRAWLNGKGASTAVDLTPAEIAAFDGPRADGSRREEPAAGTALRRRLWAAAIADGDTIGPLRDSAAALRDRWLARGYLQAAVSARGDTLLVDPGTAWTLGAWQVGGDEFNGRARLLEDWLPPAGSRFEADRIDRGARDLLEALGEMGYPFPRWVVSELRMDTASHTVSIVASLLPGTPARVGPVTTDLADPRAARFLVRVSGLETGAPIRGSDLRRAVDRLWARDLYAEVDTPRVYTTTAPDTVGVHVPARLRSKPNRVQVVLGLSRRAEDNRARLSGEVDLRLPNLAYSGRALRVGWRDDGAGQSRFGFSWLEPLAFGTPLDATLALDSEVQEQAYTRFTTEIGARLPVVALWGLELGMGWDRSTYPEGAIARTERRRARAAILHRRGDRARSGWEGSFAVESAWRSSQAREGIAGTADLASAVTQRLLSGDTAGEQWLGRSVSVAARKAVRQLSGAEREAPLSEHFRFGGAATVRGYRENEFHGVEVAWASLEWRLGSARGSRLYTFWDVGYFEFWTASTEAVGGFERRRGWPKGYGLGLLARTPGGDLSLAIGFPGTVDFDLAKLHVTLLESF